MTGDKSKFITLNFYDGISVRFGNDAPCLIKGKCPIKITDNILCYNAYYVEGLNYNLLSVSQLNKLGCKVEFKNKNAKIYYTNGKLIGRGDQTRSNLFYLDIYMMLLVLLQNLMTHGFGIRDYVMLTLIT